MYTYIPQVLLLSTLGQITSYIYNRLQDVKIIDKYPEKMNGTVKLTQSSITRQIYKELTQNTTFNSSVALSVVEGWIVKGSAKNDLTDIFESIIWGTLLSPYKASNYYGFVYRETCNLAYSRN